MYLQKCIILTLIYLIACLKIVENNNSFDKCLMCSHIIELAEQHFRRDEPQDFVLNELETECLYVGELDGGREAVMYCINQVKQNIDLIYDDFKKKMSFHEICRQLNDCK
uniref:Saposin B-type domain-containing protein n=1 Tax=Strongyloides venezuelensis TaxID=75913 RepID=A0A0K0EUE8_STRVS